MDTNKHECLSVHARFRANAFTLLELMVVIAIIVVLAGLLFPVAQSVLERAKKVQAKNDLTQIVIAVNAFYTEYGKYPLKDADQGSEKTFTTDNSNLIYTLEAIFSGDNSGDALNPRKIVFLQVQDAKDQTNPRSGTKSGNWYDPWGAISGKTESGTYHVRIDGDYNNQVANPYTSSAGATNLQAGVIAWSLGKDGDQGTDFRASDDVISWQ
jgi:prepilin-type N-terminal cleavage/methylation domain-containing protein